MDRISVEDVKAAMDKNQLQLVRHSFLNHIYDSGNRSHLCGACAISQLLIASGVDMPPDPTSDFIISKCDSVLGLYPAYVENFIPGFDGMYRKDKHGIGFDDGVAVATALIPLAYGKITKPTTV